MAKSYTFSRTANNYFNGHDLHVVDRENGRVVTVSRKSGMLAVEVKDHAIRQNWPVAAREAADALGDKKVAVIYEAVRSSYWDWAVEDLAPEHGFDTAYSEGREGGWLAIAGTQLSDDAELSETPEPDSVAARFFVVAFAAVEGIEHYRKEFFERLSTAAGMAEQNGPIACPNCGFEGDGEEIISNKHVDSGCVVGALLGVVRDRGEDIDPAKIPDIDSDALWNTLGPIADEIQETVKPAPVAAAKEA